ncbi:MAG TPA: SRPBCC family protein [Mycobacterium sp.]|jgi:uncharacterized protein YndB with AHSA1/START domain
MPGRTYSFEVNRTSSAPAATLFRLETDAGTWSQWARPLVVQSGWAQEADPPGGVGAIRKVGMWPVLVQEETLEYEPHRRHVYRLVRPTTPAKDYRAEATFTPNAQGGTDLRWRGSFTEAIPGTGRVMLAILRGAVTFFAARLVKVAERESA